MGLFRRWSILLGVTMSLPVQAADPDYYGGLMLGVANYEELGSGFNMATVTGRLGYQMSRSFAIEGRLASGGSGDASGGVAGTAYKVDFLGSLLGKLSWQPSNDLEAYLHALLGATAAQTSATIPGAPVLRNNLYGGSFGFGVDLFADRNRAVNIEWMQYLQGTVAGTTNKYKLTHFGVGYLQRF